MPPLLWHLQTAFNLTNYLTIDRWKICKNHQMEANDRYPVLRKAF